MTAPGIRAAGHPTSLCCVLGEGVGTPSLSCIQVHPPPCPIHSALPPFLSPCAALSFPMEPFRLQIGKLREKKVTRSSDSQLELDPGFLVLTSGVGAAYGSEKPRLGYPSCTVLLSSPTSHCSLRLLMQNMASPQRNEPSYTHIRHT